MINLYDDCWASLFDSWSWQGCLLWVHPAFCHWILESLSLEVRHQVWADHSLVSNYCLHKLLWYSTQTYSQFYLHVSNPILIEEFLIFILFQVMPVSYSWSADVVHCMSWGKVSYGPVPQDVKHQWNVYRLSKGEPTKITFYTIVY